LWEKSIYDDVRRIAKENQGKNFIDSLTLNENYNDFNSYSIEILGTTFNFRIRRNELKCKYELYVDRRNAGQWTSVYDFLSLFINHPYITRNHFDEFYYRGPSSGLKYLIDKNNKEMQKYYEKLKEMLKSICGTDDIQVSENNVNTRNIKDDKFRSRSTFFKGTLGTAEIWRTVSGGMIQQEHQRVYIKKVKEK